MTDVDELVTTTRFEEIHEARRQVVEDERNIYEARVTGRIDENRAKKLYKRAVDAYVRELQFVLNPPDEDGKNEYWHSKKIGDIELPRDREPIEVVGLGEYLNLPEEVVVDVTVMKKERYFHMPSPTQNELVVQPSWQLHKTAFSVANEAGAEAGLELEAGNDGHSWRFDQIAGDKRPEVSD